MPHVYPPPRHRLEPRLDAQNPQRPHSVLLLRQRLRRSRRPELGQRHRRDAADHGQRRRLLRRLPAYRAGQWLHRLLQDLERGQLRDVRLHDAEDRPVFEGRVHGFDQGAG